MFINQDFRHKTRSMTPSPLRVLVDLSCALALARAEKAELAEGIAALFRLWHWDHDPFGNGAPRSAEGFRFDLRFPGQFHDAETGLSYNYFRDYDPKIGRYIESDLIGLAGGMNTYAYVGGNPIWAVDPYGTDCSVTKDQSLFSTILSFFAKKSEKFAGAGDVIVAPVAPSPEAVEKSSGMANNFVVQGPQTIKDQDNQSPETKFTGPNPFPTQIPGPE